MLGPRPATSAAVSVAAPRWRALGIGECRPAPDAEFAVGFSLDGYLQQGRAEQCAALKVIWRSLTPAQKMQTVESSDEEDDEAAALAITTRKVTREGKGRKKSVNAVEIE